MPITVTIPRKITKYTVWEDALIVDPDLISGGFISNIDTDGTYLYVMAADTNVSTNYQDFIKTYQVNGNGSLTELHSHPLNSQSPSSYNVHDNFRGFIIVGSKLYGSYAGGFISCTINANGSLTETKNTGWRPAGAHEIFPSDLMHGKYLVCSHGGGGVGDAKWGYWTCDGTNDHTGPTYSSILSHWNYASTYGSNNFYGTNYGRTNLYHFKLTSGGTLTHEASYSLPAANANTQVRGNRVYFGSGNEIFSYNGYFPINPDGTLGTRVDTSGTLPDRFETDAYGAQPVKVKGHTYRIKDGRDVVERGVA